MYIRKQNVVLVSYLSRRLMSYGFLYDLNTRLGEECHTTSVKRYTTLLLVTKPLLYKCLYSRKNEHDSLQVHSVDEEVSVVSVRRLGSSTHPPPHHAHTATNQHQHDARDTQTCRQTQELVQTFLLKEITIFLLCIRPGF